MKVAIYTRVSKTAGDPTSIAQQDHACRAWARDHSHKVTAVYRDDGISGATLVRPALGRLLIDSTKQPFRAVVVYDLDRLARDLVVQETIIGELSQAGVDLYSVNQPNLEGDDPWRVFARQIFGASAQLHKSITVLRLHAGRQVAKQQRGHCEGPARYGFKKAGGALRPDKSEQAGVDLIRRLRAGRSPSSFRAIADELNQRGIPPRSGTKWHPNAVRRVWLYRNRPF